MLDVSGNDDPEMLIGTITPEVNWEVTESVPRSEFAANPLVLGD